MNAERDHDECIVPVAKLFPLDGALSRQRLRIQRFLAHIDESRVSVEPIDLRIPENKKILLEAGERWRRLGTFSSNIKFEEEALSNAIQFADEIGLENICLYIDGILQGFCMYQLLRNKKYIILNSLETSDEYDGLYELMLYVSARQFSEQGIQYMNLEQDLGMLDCRAQRLILEPVNFFRKYRIEPKPIFGNMDKIYRSLASNGTPIEG
jgi:hypothetical protein